MHLVTPETMGEMDRRAIEEVGIPSAVLMDRAASGAVEALLGHFDLHRGASIGIFCGTGNNGGDGLAMATLLAGRGYRPWVVVLGKADKLSDDARLYFEIAKKIGIDLEIAHDGDSLEKILGDPPPCALYCDALLGTGLDRAVEGRYAGAIEFLSRQEAPLFAVDLPSGLDGRTGQVLGVAAAADMTATFGFAKIGQLLDPARQLCGRLVVVDIGIPQKVRDEVGVDAEGLDQSWLPRHLPPRPIDMHKGSAGRTLHIGGRPGTTGAIALSARGALVGGAGLITVATDCSTASLIPSSTPEVMSRGLFDFARETFDGESFIEMVEASDTVVIGPGLGTDELAMKIMEAVIESAPPRLIVDADGLNLIAAQGDLSEKLADLGKVSHIVLTPHPGEQARLQKRDIKAVLADPCSSARELAEEMNAVVVLKTAATIIASHDGRLAVNRTGNPGMATGGMGDALTGLIASAFGDFSDDPYLAACCAVVVHGLAGDRGAEKNGLRGLTVVRLLDEVPGVWQSWQA